jgi:hypothetical protein
MITNQSSYLKRMYQYQKERFPVVLNGIAVLTFTFSAISFSRICRGAEGFVSLSTFLIGCFATFTLFLLVRIFDEFKDRIDDAQYRTYLPVPRGLVSLNELKVIGIGIGVLQITSIAIFQLEMLPLYLLVIGYLCLMGVEFFVPILPQKASNFVHHFAHGHYSFVGCVFEWIGLAVGRNLASLWVDLFLRGFFYEWFGGGIWQKIKSA